MNRSYRLAEQVRQGTGKPLVKLHRYPEGREFWGHPEGSGAARKMSSS